MKKNFFKKFELSISVILLVFMVFFSQVFASSDTNLSSLFSNAINSDGMLAEENAQLVSNEFTNSPLSFLKALAKFSNNDIDYIADNLLYCNDLSQLKGGILDLKSSINPSTDEARVINRILEYIDKQENYKPDFAKNEPNQIQKSGFNESIISSFISKANSDVDEEYSEIINKAFRKDPNLFSQIATELSEDKIINMAHFIAYDSIKKDQQSVKIDEIIKANLSESQRKAIDKINNQIININNKNVIKKSISNSNSSPTPAITNITNLSERPVVGEKTNINVTLKESSNLSVERNYYVELYMKIGNSTYLKEAKQVTISTGSDSCEITFQPTLYSLGTYNSYVKVYSGDSSTKLSELLSASSMATTGKWSISVFLKTNRDYVGWELHLWNPSGSSVWYTDTVLGRSDSGDSPLVYRGNTPTGYYTGHLTGPTSPASSYGPYQKVSLIGVSGQIITSGRTEIAIHGGTPETNTSATWYPLRPTYGCVRITNSDEGTLASQINSLISNGANTVGDVQIFE